MERERGIHAALRRLRRGGVDDAATPSSPAKSQGGEQLSLGDLNEGRDGVREKLRQLRERAPSRPSLPRRERATDAAPVGLRARAAGAGGGSPSPAPKGGSPPPPPPPSNGGGPGLLQRAEALLSGAGRALGSAGTAAAHRWSELPRIARQRIAAGAIVLAVVAFVVWVLIPAAPCGAPGGDSCPAEDHAIALVPDDALAYAHVDIDPDGEQLAAASAYGDRLPLLGGLLLGSVSDVAGKPVDFRTQVSPWAGDEAALAVLPQLPATATVTMIEADDVDGANDFAADVIGPATTENIGGLAVQVGENGQASALLDGFLLIGDEDGVKAMVAGDDIGNLGTAAVAAGIDDLPEDRFAYAYLSGDGARALLQRGSQLSTLDTFVNSQASEAVTAALSFEGGLASLTIRSEQDPDLAAEHPAFFSALPQFNPALDADVGPDALAYLGLGDPASSVDSLLERAQSGAPALVEAYDRASRDLRKAGGVSISDDLLPLLGSEAALSVEPVAGEEAPTPGVLESAGVPYVSLIADGVDSKAAAQSLADLQKPLTEALAPSGGEAAGQVAVFAPLQIAGIEAQSLAVSPNVELTYATYDDRLVVATKPIGIAQARDGGDGLADSSDYRGVTSGMPADVSMLTYLDLRDLLSIGEQIGLGADPAYARLAPDLRALQPAALSVDDTGEEVRTDINISLGEPEEPDPDATGIGAE